MDVDTGSASEECYVRGIEDPAVVLDIVVPCAVPEAPVALEAFKQEVYGSSDQFRHVFVESPSIGLVAAVVFPRSGIDRLAAICAEKNLILVRGIPTVFHPKTNEYCVFDVKGAISHLTDTCPAIKDVYTFGNRRKSADPLIVEGFREWGRPDALEVPAGYSSTLVVGVFRDWSYPEMQALASQPPAGNN